MRLIFLRYKWMFFSIVFFIIAIPMAGFFIKNAAPTQKPIDLCEQFEKASYPLSCEKAVERALANTKGNVENITIGPLELNPTLKKIQDNLKFKNEMWHIDIKLEKPFTARDGSQVKSLRIEIPTDGTDAIFRVSIKS